MGRCMCKEVHMYRDDSFDALRYSLFTGTPKLVEPLLFNIPQPSAYECLEKETEMADYKFIREEIETRAERRGLVLSTKYVSDIDRLVIYCSKMKDLNYSQDDITIYNLSRKKTTDVLKTIDSWLKNKFVDKEDYTKPSGLNISIMQIKDVIFNDPATIVFWADDTKTVVKCQDGDIYDPEKGLAMAISKKALGNNYDSYNTFKKWLKKVNK